MWSLKWINQFTSNEIKCYDWTKKETSHQYNTPLFLTDKTKVNTENQTLFPLNFLRTCCLVRWSVVQRANLGAVNCLALHVSTLHRGSAFGIMVGGSQLGTAGSISRAMASAPLISPRFSCFPTDAAACAESLCSSSPPCGPHWEAIRNNTKQREPHINEKNLPRVQGCEIEVTTFLRALLCLFKGWSCVIWVRWAEQPQPPGVH